MKFEYTIVRLQPQDDLDFLDRLNGMGSQGWEFTGHTERAETGERLYFLKRVVGSETNVIVNSYQLSKEDHIEQDYPEYDRLMRHMYGTPPKLLTVRERQSYGTPAGSFPSSQIVYSLSGVETILQGRVAEKISDV